MKDKYREETNKDVYANDMYCGCGGSDGSYSDEYVKWLESEVKKLHIQNVGNSAEYTRGYKDGWRDCCQDVKEFG